MCYEEKREELTTTLGKRDKSQPAKDECLRQCPLECRSVHYTTETTTVPVGERHLAWILARRERFSMSANLLANISVPENALLTLSTFYLDRLQETHSHQIPKVSVCELVAKIGGLLSLFLDLITVYRVLF
jgi:hypothetical protein